MLPLSTPCRRYRNVKLHLLCPVLQRHRNRRGAAGVDVMRTIVPQPPLHFGPCSQERASPTIHDSDKDCRFCEAARKDKLPHQVPRKESCLARAIDEAGFAFCESRILRESFLRRPSPSSSSCATTVIHPRTWLRASRNAYKQCKTSKLCHHGAGPGTSRLTAARSVNSICIHHLKIAMGRTNTLVARRGGTGHVAHSSQYSQSVRIVCAYRTTSRYMLPYKHCPNPYCRCISTLANQQTPRHRTLS
jgi:hypothetical protein